MAIIFQVTDGSSSDRHHRDATYETVPPWPFPNHPRYSVQRGGALPWSLDQNSPGRDFLIEALKYHLLKTEQKLL
ncbi:uncharacterized protein LOC136032377 isoform X2 [Artemia franciscana]|uniref:uncharacterized protein LOC136032377 isoform X2 n=1 Tax=Artemia franciscana TaxID=6661 RepID=UPI0032DA79BA